MAPGRTVLAGAGLIALLAAARTIWPSADNVAVGEPIASPAPLTWQPPPPASPLGSVASALAAPPAPAARASVVVPISATAPRQLLVGEMQELTVGIGSPATVGEISFVVQFDPHVLQVRAALEGGWAMVAGHRTRFANEISGTEDRVRIRATVAGQRAGLVSGSVAIVQFQAMAPGATSILISDVVVKDPLGGPIASTVNGSNLQVMVESAPASPLRGSQPAADAPPDLEAAGHDDGD